MAEKAAGVEIELVFNEFGIGIEEPGVSVTEMHVDVPLKNGPEVRIEYQRETIFISGKGRLQYSEFFDLCEEDCEYLGFDTSSFYDTVQPAVRKAIVRAENMWREPPVQPAPTGDWQKVNQLAENILDICKPECESELAIHIVEAAYRTIYEVADGLSNIATIQKGES